MRTSLFLAVAAAALAGCGGSGRPYGPTTTGNGGNNGGGNGGGTTPTSYNAPTAVNNISGRFLLAASQNGHLVGMDIQLTTPYYWDSPTSAPITLKNGGMQHAVPLGVNGTGQIVGYAEGGAGMIPIYWDTPTDNPVAMQLPAGQTQAGILSINRAGQMVGWAGDVTSSTVAACVWISPTTAPQILADSAGSPGVGFQALRITDAGVIFGANENSLSPVMWSSLSANATALSSPGGSFIPASNQAFAVNPETGEAGGGVDSSTIFPVYWSPPSETLVLPPLPAGDTEETVLQGIGPNHELVGIAGTSPSKGVVWTSPTTPFKDLNTLIPSGTGWHLYSAQFMLDDGEIIGQATDSGNNSVWYDITPKS